MRIGAFALACASMIAVSRVALADDVAAARKAYEHATALFKAKRYGEAAAEFAKADDLAPNATALESALTAATSADDAALGMTLVDRADARGATGAVADAASKARAKFQGRAGKLRVRCLEGHSCTATVDGDAAMIGRSRWVSAGEHTIAVESDATGGGGSFKVSVDGGATVDWQPPAPPPPAPPPLAPSATAPVAAPPSSVPPPYYGPTAAEVRAEPDDTGISKAWFFAGVGVTLIGAGITTWSGVDTLNKHASWNDTGDPQANSDGRSAQTRTNVLLGATVGAAAVTAVVGIALVRWSSKKKTVGYDIGPMSASFRARF